MERPHTIRVHIEFMVETDDDSEQIVAAAREYVRNVTVYRDSATDSWGWMSQPDSTRRSVTITDSMNLTGVEVRDTEEAPLIQTGSALNRGGGVTPS